MSAREEELIAREGIVERLESENSVALAGASDLVYPAVGGVWLGNYLETGKDALHGKRHAKRLLKQVD